MARDALRLKICPLFVCSSGLTVCPVLSFTETLPIPRPRGCMSHLACLSGPGRDRRPPPPVARGLTRHVELRSGGLLGSASGGNCGIWMGSGGSK